MKNPFLALFLSLALPGLGQLYLGERAKGWTLLCMTAGVFTSIVVSRSWFVGLVMGAIYLLVVLPAAMDAFQSASGKPRIFIGNSVLYVIFMLVAVGPFALPLLWQSPRFSKKARMGWTVLVVLVAILAIWITTFLAASFDEAMKQVAATSEAQ